MANKNEAKIKFTAETAEFNDAIRQSESTMKVLRAELKLNETQMKATGETVEALENKHSILQKQLEASEDKTKALSNKLEAAARIYGENSTEVDKWRTQLLNAQTAQERLKQDISNCENELKQLESATDGAADAMDDLSENLDDAGDAARDAGDGFTVMKGVVADLASEAIQFAIDKVGEFISYLGDLPEATREFRQDMATLTTSFDSAGFTAETAQETWKDLYTIFGEDDRAVEAANLISKMSDSQKDLTDWTTITMGVWGEYQDSLAVEALAEAANETVKTGTVTGNLADALNWSTEAARMFAKYMSEDVTTAEDAFNVALSECTSEQERHALITETLLTLYGDSAQKYAEASGTQLEAKEAAAELALAEAEMATAIEPLTTAWDGLKAELMTAVVPAVGAVAGALTGLINFVRTIPQGIGNAWTATKTITNSTYNSLKSVVSGAWSKIKSDTVSAANSVKTTVSSAWTNTRTSISSAAESAKNSVSSAWNSVKSTTSSAFNSVKSSAASAWNGIKANISTAVNSAKSTVSNAWNSVKSATSSAFNSVKSTAASIWNSIKSSISNAINGAVSAVRTAVGKLKSAMNFSWSLPKLKLPHVKITGKFSLNPPSVPKFSIDWYKHGAIFTQPTMFATPFGFKGVGEAGAEAVLPIDKLEGYIMGAIEKTQQQVDLRALASAIESLANRPVELNINSRQFALATASDGDSVNGLRSSFKNRGLVID